MWLKGIQRSLFAACVVGGLTVFAQHQALFAVTQVGTYQSVRVADSLGLESSARLCSATLEANPMYSDDALLAHLSAWLSQRLLI